MTRGEAEDYELCSSAREEFGRAFCNFGAGMTGRQLISVFVGRVDTTESSELQLIGLDQHVSDFMWGGRCALPNCVDRQRREERTEDN